VILRDFGLLLGDIAQLIGVFVEIVVALVVLFILLRWAERRFPIKLVRKTELTQFVSKIIAQGFRTKWQGFTFGKYGLGVLYFEKEVKPQQHPQIPTDGAN
jgi:hypothetical protein